MAKWISPEDKKRQEMMIGKIVRYQNCIVHNGDDIEKVTEVDTARIDYYIAPPNNPTKLYPAELRYRNIKSADYSTVFLNLSKWEIGREAAAKLGTHFLFFVQWEDGLFWINESKGTLGVDRRIEYNGRNVPRDRNDDKTDVVLIPVCQFTRICD